MPRWKVLQVKRGEVQVAFGPIKFWVSVQAQGEKVLVTKPSSLYIDTPDFRELLSLVRVEYLKLYRW